VTEAGSGCYLPERACLHLGTAGIIGTFASAEELDRLGRTIHPGSVTATGAALRWTRALFASLVMVPTCSSPTGRLNQGGGDEQRIASNGRL
jgi:hypothetical protein